MITEPTFSTPPVADSDYDIEGIEETEDLEDSPQNKKRGTRLKELMKILSDANEEGTDDEMLDEKIEFLLEEASHQEPSIDGFIGKQSYYTESIARRDKQYVADREHDFTETERLAKIAEAIAGQAIRDGELFSCVGNIKTVVNNPVTRYDDIANGIDQAVTLITRDGETDSFAFDITIGHSNETVIKKLFRPYKTPSGTQVDTIGQSRLKYGQEPTLNEKGAYESVTCKTIDPIPRFTLAYDEDDVLEMANAVTVEKGFSEGQVDIYTNPSSETILNTTLQTYEQCVFFTEAAKVKLNELKKSIDRASDPKETEELTKQAEAIKEQIAQLDKLAGAIEPTLRDAYQRARSETLPRKSENARPDSKIRRKLFCSGYLGTATGKFIDMMHYYEGYGDNRDEEEEKLTDQYIEEAREKISKEYHRKHPNDIFEPSLTAEQVINMEYEAVMKAKKTMFVKYRHRMPERLKEGAEEYERIEEENYRRRMSA